MGLGPDVIIEAIGLPETFRAAVEEVAFTGRVVYIGYAKEPVAYETRLFVQKELDIMGSRNAQPEDFRRVIRCWRAGVSRLTMPLVLSCPCKKLRRSFAKWNDDPTRFTKIMIRLD